MLIDGKCRECEGLGNISGIAGFDDNGDIIEGFFPCERCNGEGKEVCWYQDCSFCFTTGLIEKGYGEEFCSKCLGRGFLLPQPSSRMSRWEKISE